MISSNEITNFATNKENSSGHSDDDGWGSDFDEPISALYAQEIEENKINENLEALSRTSAGIFSKENNVVEESAGKRIGLTQNISKPKLIHKSGAIPKHAFSYLNSNSSSANIKPKPICLKPEHGNFAEHSLEGQTSNSVGKTDPFLETEVTYTNTSQQVSDSKVSGFTNRPRKLRPEAFDFLKKHNPANSKTIDTQERDDDSYLKLADAKTLTPPPPLPSRPPPVFKYPPGTFSKITEASSNTQSIPVTVNTKKEIQLADKVADLNLQSKTSQLTKIGIRDGNKNDWRKVEAGDMTKLNCSLETPPLIPRPVKSAPIRDKLNKQQKQLHQRDQEQKADNIFFSQIKTAPIVIDRAEQIKVKPKVPKKPDQIVHQPLDKRMINRSYHECEIQLPTRKITPRFEAIKSDIPKRSMSVDNCDNANIDALPRKKNSSFDKSDIIKVDDDIRFSKPASSLRSKIDIPRAETSMTQVKHEQNKDTADQQQLTDFDVLQNAMNRPSLPQKLKTTQRSISCNSLVQTFKDISMAIWSPPEKEKRISVGVIPSAKIAKDVKSEDVEPFTRNISPAASVGFIKEGHKSIQDKAVLEIEKASMTRNLWYHDINDTEAKRRLLSLDQDGAFLIRPSSRPKKNIQYTASIAHSGRVFHIHIRRNENYQYALGSEREGEKVFPSISDLIKYYQDVPFEIRPSGCSDLYGLYFRVTPPR